MLKDYTVTVSYKNSQSGDIATRSYGYEEYCNGIRNSAIAAIGDIEKLLASIEDNVDVNKWSNKSRQSYKTIRHKLLDVANNVARLPLNTCCKGQRIQNIDLTDFIAESLNK